MPKRGEAVEHQLAGDARLLACGREIELQEVRVIVE